MLDAAGCLPEVVVACVGGGSNAIGMFAGFLDDADVRIVGVEARGAASLGSGTPGVLHGARSAVLADEDGQILDAHSISAGPRLPGRRSRARRAARRGAGRVPERDATTRRWPRSAGSPRPRGSSRRSSRRTPWRARPSSTRRPRARVPVRPRRQGPRPGARAPVTPRRVSEPVSAAGRPRPCLPHPIGGWGTTLHPRVDDSAEVRRRLCQFGADSEAAVTRKALVIYLMAGPRHARAGASGRRRRRRHRRDRHPVLRPARGRARDPPRRRARARAGHAHAPLPRRDPARRARSSTCRSSR